MTWIWGLVLCCPELGCSARLLLWLPLRRAATAQYFRRVIHICELSTRTNAIYCKMVFVACAAATAAARKEKCDDKAHVIKHKIELWCSIHTYFGARCRSRRCSYRINGGDVCVRINWLFAWFCLIWEYIEKTVISFGCERKKRYWKQWFYIAPGDWRMEARGQFPIVFIAHHTRKKTVWINLGSSFCWNWILLFGRWASIKDRINGAVFRARIPGPT